MDTTNAPAPAADELTITLRKPVSFGTLEFTKLIVREPTASEMAQWDSLGSSAAGVIKAVSIVSGVPEPAVKMIGVRDLLAASNFISSFSAVPEKTADGEPPAELVVPLRTPVPLGTEIYTQLDLREPTAADLLDWDTARGVEADIKIIAAVSGVPKTVVRSVGARDFVLAADYLANFLVPGLTAGARS